MKQKEENKIDLLRFITSGNVDDGKSTLIGRLLYDTKSVLDDQLKSIEEISQKLGSDHLNLALLTDGLKAEREQGITIDVAYRYFSTNKRKFIMADTPGHLEYTRNMVTGASTAQLSIILIDARNGITEQTKRHSYISALLGVKKFIICVNKMDLVGFNEDVFEKIKKEYIETSSSLNVPEVFFIPISALRGDNVVNKSINMPWYKGKTVLETLEEVEIGSDIDLPSARFPVQKVIRPQSDERQDFRGYAGRVEGGVFHKGDSVIVLPSNIKTKIAKIYLAEKELQEAFYPMSVTVTLDDDVDISRGDMLVKEKDESLPTVSSDFNVDICWFGEKPMNHAGSYILKHTTRESRAVIKDVLYKINIDTFEKVTDDKEISKNDIARISLKTAKPLFYDSYKDNRQTGSVILIDENTNETVGAGMIV